MVYLQERRWDDSNEMVRRHLIVIYDTQLNMLVLKFYVSVLVLIYNSQSSSVHSIAYDIACDGA